MHEDIDVAGDPGIVVTQARACANHTSFRKNRQHKKYSLFDGYIGCRVFGMLSAYLRESRGCGVWIHGRGSGIVTPDDNLSIAAALPL
jgi:hypothetical protein